MYVFRLRHWHTWQYKTYKAYKAFMAFKLSRLNPFQNYRSITSFSVDWPRTMRFAYTSVSILSVCAIMLQVTVIQTRSTKDKNRQKSFINKNLFVRHVIHWQIFWEITGLYWRFKRCWWSNSFPQRFINLYNYWTLCGSYSWFVLASQNFKNCSENLYSGK